MSNYYIIGGDGKQYGPITSEEVRRWASEGRLNAQTQTRLESETEWRPLGGVPEFVEFFGATAAAEAPVSEPVGPTDWSTQGYELDIGGCISRGWTVYKDNFGTLFLAFFISLLLTYAGVMAVGIVVGKIVDPIHQPAWVVVTLNYILTAVFALVIGPLWGGCYLVYLKTIRREPTGIGEIFAGFQEGYLQLFLGGLVVSMVTKVCMLPADILWQVKSQPLLAHIQAAQNDPTAIQKLIGEMLSAFTGVLPLFLVCLVPATYLAISLMFTLPLIIDKQMTFGAAIKIGWKMVNKHWFQLFGLTLLVGLVVLSGILGCCIGLLFTPPIGIAASMYAYETIFRPPTKS